MEDRQVNYEAEKLERTKKWKRLAAVALIAGIHVVALAGYMLARVRSLKLYT